MNDVALLVTTDLMLSSQVDLDCRRANVTLEMAHPDNWVERSGDAKWVFWDLSQGLPSTDSIEESRLKSPFTLIALGPHVDEVRLQQARDVGCDVVMARGKFLRELSQILAKSEDQS